MSWAGGRPAIGLRRVARGRSSARGQAVFAVEGGPHHLAALDILPPLISLTLLTALVSFMFKWLSAFLHWTPSIELGRIPADLTGRKPIVGTVEFADVARIIVTNLLLMAPILLALRRWRLPLGSVTFVFTSVAVMMAGLAEYRLGGRILAAAAGGAAADLLIRRRHSLAHRSVAWNGRPRRFDRRAAELSLGPAGGRRNGLGRGGSSVDVRARGHTLGHRTRLTHPFLDCRAGAAPQAASTETVGNSSTVSPSSSSCSSIARSSFVSKRSRCLSAR